MSAPAKSWRKAEKKEERIKELVRKKNVLANRY
jgi:hypothetical protein